jgi:hypothetical protein
MATQIRTASFDGSVERMEKIFTRPVRAQRTSGIDRDLTIPLGTRVTLLTPPGTRPDGKVHFSWPELGVGRAEMDVETFLLSTKDPE